MDNNVEKELNNYFNKLPGGSRVSVQNIVQYIQLQTKSVKSSRLVQALATELVSKRDDLSLSKGQGICKDVIFSENAKPVPRKEILPGHVGVIYKPCTVPEEIEKYLDSMPVDSRVPTATLVKIIRTLLGNKSSTGVVKAYVLDIIETRADVEIRKGLGIVKLKTR